MGLPRILAGAGIMAWTLLMAMLVSWLASPTVPPVETNRFNMKLLVSLDDENATILDPNTGQVEFIPFPEFTKSWNAPAIYKQPFPNEDYD